MTHPTWTTDAKSFSTRAFDYLVVGAGTAGTVIASRLSEDPNVTVGLIEAGTPAVQNDSINIPGRYGESLGSSFDYAYKTTLQDAASGRQIEVPRGKGLGGTSLLNFMVWMRPNAADIDHWAEEGNRGWSWTSLLPYYRKSERLLEPTIQEQEQYSCGISLADHGRDGPVPVRLCKQLCFSGLPFQQTLNNLDVPTLKSAYSGSNAGVFSSLVNVDPITGHRAHAAQTYLVPNCSRPNLHVLTGVEVERIILEQRGPDMTATGVELSSSDHIIKILASREVIVSCGAFYSPVLLEKSGIGNPDVLSRLEIAPKVSNKNVGARYQDHSMLSIVYEIDSESPSRDDLSDDKLAAQADAQFKATQTGPRALLSTTLAYLNVHKFTKSHEIESLISTSVVQDGPRSCYSTDTQLGQMEYIPIVGQFNPYFQSAPGKKYLTLLQIQQYPFSAGSVHGSLEGHKISPRIDPNLFGTPEGEIDLHLHALALRDIVQKIESTAPLSTLLRKRVWPPAEMTEMDDYRQWIRDTATFDWHPVGTCRMGGSRSADGGVVDERLRVYGVKGLRVADASIMPRQICAHPQATITAIAEMASDLIKEDQASMA